MITQYKFHLPLLDKYWEQISFCYGDVFLYQCGKVYVMDNHKSALWCWMKECDANKHYNFFHIDMHYDMCDCYETEDAIYLREHQDISFEDYCKIQRQNPLKGTIDGCPMLRWDNFIHLGQATFPNWFSTNFFYTQKFGDIGKSWHPEKQMHFTEQDILHLVDDIDAYIGAQHTFLDGYSAVNDYENKWILSIDLDFFYVYESIMLFSKDYIRLIARKISESMHNIAVVTVALSPDYMPGEDMRDKWKRSIDLLELMSEEIQELVDLVTELKNKIILTD